MSLGYCCARTERYSGESIPMRFVTILTAALLLSAQPTWAQWQPPIGIPAPSFGINDPQPSAPSSWSSSPSSATSGYYYVCRSCAGATDSNNTFGHPSVPRASMPTSVSAGAYIQVQGTGYSLGGTQVVWSLNGAAGAPVWVVGVGNPDCTGNQTELNLRGNYWIVKGLRLVNVRIRTGNGSTNGGSAFVALRDTELTGWSGTGTTSLIGPYTSSGALAHDQVFFRLNVHDNGPYTDSYGDIDQHGIGLGGYSYNMWILDSSFTRNTGDGVQINSSNGTITSLTDERLGHHIYVGRNTFNANWQNGFWAKDIRDTIFSENVSVNHRVTSYGPGVCGGAQYGPERVWFIYNTCHSNHGGIRIQSDSSLHGSDMYFIGNLIYNNNLPSPQSSPGGDDQAGLVMRDMANRYVVNNTIWGNDGGVHCNTSPMTTFVLVNNIIGNNRNSADADLLCDTSATNTTIRNNIFQGNRISYNHQTESLSAFMTRTGFGTGSKTTAPSFTNAGAGDFSLATADTAAKDGGISHSVYATFQSLYGLNIAVDKNGRPRPQGAGWDIGAYEGAGSGGGLPSPPAPSNLRIISSN